MSDNSPSWKPDPTGKHDHRYWDGSQWTDNVSDAGVASTDPYVADAAAGAAADDTVADTPVVAASPEPPAPVDPTVATPAAPGPEDVTAAWPTAPAAPGGPTPPPPYVPTAGSSGGGSKRGLLVGGAILAVVAIVVAVFALSGDDDDGSEVRAQLASKLQEEGDVSEDDAECLADFFVDELGADAFEGVDFDAAEPPEELQEAFVDAGQQALEECDIDESALGGTDGDTDDGDTDDSTDGGDGGDGTYGSDPELDALWDDCEDGDYAACDDLFNESPSGSEYEDFGDTCGNRNEPKGYCVDVYGEDGGGDDGGLTDSTDSLEGYEDLLVDTFRDSLGLSQDQAECLAGELSGAVEDGELSEEDAMAEYLNFLEACDIDMSEIGAN